MQYLSALSANNDWKKRRAAAQARVALRESRAEENAIRDRHIAALNAGFPNAEAHAAHKADLAAERAEVDAAAERARIEAEAEAAKAALAAAQAAAEAAEAAKAAQASKPARGSKKGS